MAWHRVADWQVNLRGWHPRNNAFEPFDAAEQKIPHATAAHFSTKAEIMRKFMKRRSVANQVFSGGDAGPPC